MTREPKFADSVNNWTVEQRITEAKVVIEDLTFRILNVLKIHASTEIVLYSSKIADQIGPSRAASSFNNLRDNLFEIEVVKLLALWDKPQRNSISIPTALLLIDDHAVIAKLCSDVHEAHSNRQVSILNPSLDPAIQRAIEKSIKDSQKMFALEQATKAELALRACIRAASLMSSGELAEGLLNLRDRVAHSLTQTRREIEGKNSHAKYGEEREILIRTIAIIEDLYCWVNGTSFDIGRDCFEIAREEANDFWGNLKFSPDEDVL